MGQVIYIYGASGSGVTTLGRAVSKELGYNFLDTDSFYWIPTDPPFSKKREINERVSLIETELLAHENSVIAGALDGWGDPLIKYFTLCVRLVLDTKSRLERLRNREFAEFGTRILPGGDMYENHQDFLEWAKKYDTAGVEMRSLKRHENWEKNISCKVLVLNGSNDVKVNVKLVKEGLK